MDTTLLDIYGRTFRFNAKIANHIMKGGDDSVKNGGLFKMFGKFLPVIAAGVVALCQALGDMRAQEQLDELEERVEKLENGEES